MNWKKEKAMVFGGGGFLGSNIVKRLKALGCPEIRIFGRSPHRELLPDGVTICRGDIRDKNAVSEVCNGMTVVFHTAAKAGVWGDYEEYYRININGTNNVINACRENDIGKLVFTSSPSVAYPPTKHIENIDESAPYPDNYLASYPYTKALAEQDVMNANSSALNTVSIRPHLIWGPGDPHLLPRVLQAAAAGKLMIVGDGKNMVDMTYIDNAVEAHIRAAEALHCKPELVGGRTYFVSDDKPVLLWEWLGGLLKELSLPAPSKSLSYKKAYFIGACLEVIYGFLPFASEPPMTRFVAGQFAFSHYFNISAAKRDLGYKPLISHDEALSRTIEYLKNLNIKGS